jgi:hypothetical protein
MEPEGSLPHSQVPATCPYPEPAPITFINFFCQLSVLWDDAIAVSVGKLRKLWDSLSELRSSLYEWRLEKIGLRPVLLPVKSAQFTQFFRQVRRHTVKSFRLAESVQGFGGKTWGKETTGETQTWMGG